MKREKQTVLTLNGDSFKHYLLLRYVNNSSNPKWKLLNFVSADSILPEIWIQLVNYAKADVESRGGKLIGYEVISNKEILKHDRVLSEFWPSSWMWVISKNNS